MPPAASEPLLSAHEHPVRQMRKVFSAPLVAVIVVLLGTFFALVQYPSQEATDEHVNRYYTFFIHIMIMIFVGFGFLMTFLRRYSYSAIGLNYFTSSLVILASIIAIGFTQQIATGPKRTWIELDLPLLIDSAFAAGAAMISFGAVLGKTTPAQITWLLLLQVPLYAASAHLATEVLSGLDIGGSITIHMFGAYYGLAASLVLSHEAGGSAHPKNGAGYTSDMTAMIGTIFLFIFWPSFNGALASGVPGTEAPGGFQQFNCILNTVLSLLGATVITFVASAAMHNKFDMVHVQNATLAGGVAIGSAANLMVSPGGALAVGVAAGLLSVGGYMYLMPRLEASIGLRDTCGVHNLHGMPGVLGGLVAAIVAVAAPEANAAVMMHAGSKQALWQLAALGATLAIALVGGTVAGAIVAKVSPTGHHLGEEDLFEDALFCKEGRGNREEVEPEAKVGELRGLSEA